MFLDDSNWWTSAWTQFPRTLRKSLLDGSKFRPPSLHPDSLYSLDDLLRNLSKTMIGGGSSDGWDEDTNHTIWDNFDWPTEEHKVKLEDLVILHFREGTSNKVWGCFQLDGIWQRFWGKSSAAKFQAKPDTKMTILETQDKKVKKGYIPIKADSQLFKDVSHVLESQFGIAPEVLRSLVTGEEIDRPIKPSEVVATLVEEHAGSVIFWDERGEVIGTRSLEQWEKIRDHMLRSKFIKNVNPDGTQYWAEKDEVS